MGVADFQPQETLDQNSNGVGTVFNMLNTQDRNWLTQGTGSIQRWGCASAHGYFSAVAAHDGDIAFVNLLAESLTKVGKAVAECITRDYDAVYPCQVQRERTVTVEVQKTRKVGLFKKETYIDHESRIEKYLDSDPIIYKGWKIEQLRRQEVFHYPSGGGDSDTLLLDYYLGADGNLYFVVSVESDQAEPKVYRCVNYSPLFLANTYCNVYTAALGGVIGVLDAIPIDPNDQRRNAHMVFSAEEEHYYNFPIQIDNLDTFPYKVFDGAIQRMIGLLDENERKLCLEKNDWLSEYMQ